MNEELKKLAQDFIILPFVLKVFQQDKKRFNVFNTPNVYISMLEAVIEKIQKDIIATKQQLYTKYHLDIKRVGKTEYRWNSKGESGVFQYTSEELREMTKEKMEKYLQETEFQLNDI